MVLYKCKMCGGNLLINPDGVTYTCDSCTTVSTAPNEKEEKRAIAYNRAEKLRRNCQFDLAIKAYERLVEEDEEDAEVYWGLLLSRYGIEYVKDPDSGEYNPTCHRAQTGSILSDLDYLEVKKRASNAALEIYEAEAKRIELILQEILSIATRQEQYQVFICYKENFEGKRTMDSVRARSIYDKLTAKGIRTFYAPESLEPGKNFEPIIFSAINSAKVMLLLGSDARYFEAVWVRNEWTRFLALLREGKDKYLIPVFWDIIPEMDFPKEIAGMQGVDLGTPVGEFTVIEQVEKLLGKKAVEPKRQSATDRDQVDKYFIRADNLLENGAYDEAKKYYVKVLDLYPESARAYWGILLSERSAKDTQQLIVSLKPIEDDMSYKSAVKYAEGEQKSIYVSVNKEIKAHIGRVESEIEHKIEKEFQPYKKQLSGTFKELKLYKEKFEDIYEEMKRQEKIFKENVVELPEGLDKLREEKQQLLQEYNRNTTINRYSAKHAVEQIKNLQQERNKINCSLSNMEQHMTKSEHGINIAQVLNEYIKLDTRIDAIEKLYIGWQKEVQVVETEYKRLMNKKEEYFDMLRGGKLTEVWEYLGDVVK